MSEGAARKGAGLDVREVAHDLNNLLCVAENCVAQALGQGVGGELPRQRLVVAVNAIQKAALLVRHLQISGTSNAELPALDVNAAIQDSVPVLLETLGEHARLELRLDADPALAHVTTEQVLRILLNLVTNARDAVAGSGSVAIRTRTTEGHVVLAVTDSGPGIPARTQDSVFREGFSTKGEFARGLGLTIVKELVAGLGGLLDLKSAPGEGTTIEVYLPAVP